MVQEDIVCISTSEWDFLWTRKQRLMARLAKHGNRVLYVDPCYASRSERLRPGVGLGFAYGSHVRNVSENLWVMQPPFPLPLGRFQWSRTLSDLRLASGIRQFLPDHGFQRPLLWIYPPTALGLVHRIPHGLLIYEVVDDYAEYPTYDEAMRNYIRQCETKMLKMADLVFVTSGELLKGREEINRNIFVSPNGVDIELFARAQDPSVEVPDDIRGISRPILGFVGGIAPWTDLDMVLEVALRKPNWSIVLIGPVASGLDLKRLDSVKNVHLLGRRPAELLPSYLKGMDVCLNLFKRTPLTRAVNPLKVYEYLAAGKPVVSTPMPEVEKFDGLVLIGRDVESFVLAIEQALNSPHGSSLIKARMKSVAPYSWKHIFDEVISKVNEGIQQFPGRVHCRSISGTARAK